MSFCKQKMRSSIVKLFNRTTVSVPTAALILGSAALASRILGLLRDRVLTGSFGAGTELDVYFAAFRIPDLIYSVLIGGAISSAFIPVFISHFTRDKNEAWEIARSLFYIVLGGLLVIAVLIFILMPRIIPFIAPGFDDSARQLVTTMSRIMLLSTIFLGLSAVLSGILHSFRKFFVYSLAPIFYNLGIIIGALFFVPLWGLSGLAYGVVLGAFLHMAVQLPVSMFSGFKPIPIAGIFHPALWRILKLMLPRAFGLGAYQLNLIAITAIASTLAAGSLAIFTLANNIQYLPIGIIGISFATAVFPSLSSSLSKNDYKKYLEEFSRAFRIVLFLVLPVSFLFFVLRAHIVRIIYGTGQFGWEDTRLTAAALGAFSIGIFAYALSPIVSRAFYAQENTKTPVIANSIGIALNIILSVLLIYVIFPRGGLLVILGRLFKIEDLPSIAIIGLPLAFSISGIVALSLLLVAFFKDKRNISIAPSLLASAIRIGAASIFSGLVAWFMLKVFVLFISSTETFLLISSQAAFASLISGASYFLIAYIFKFEELHWLFAVLRSKFTKTNIPSHGAGESVGGFSHD